MIESKPELLYIKKKSEKKESEQLIAKNNQFKPCKSLANFKLV